jgi:hypothetical protein
MNRDQPTRRDFTVTALGAGVAGLLGPWEAFGRADEVASVPPTRPSHRYKVAACDWMLLKRQKLGAFQLSKDCGMDGVESTWGASAGDPTS